MALTITKVLNTYSTSPQITPDDVAEIADLGYKSIINTRPDQEGGSEQPTSDAIKLAAEKLGLQYYHIPVVPNNIQSTQVDEFSNAFETAPKPILGFCRTGNRATRLLELSQSNHH
jgi:uncharacterized protein (TIGR01244 family)